MSLMKGKLTATWLLQVGVLWAYNSFSVHDVEHTFLLQFYINTSK